MPFKRKITTREAPKRSSRRGGSGRRKISQIGLVKEKKVRARHV